MENAMVNFLGSAGISAVGYFFAYIVLKQKFKQDEIITQEIKELCAGIKELIGSIADLKAVQQSHFEIEKMINDEQKTNYIKICNKIESQNIKIDEIYTLCLKLYGQSDKSPLGQIAITKGYMSKEQLKDCLETQRNVQKEY